MLPLKEQFEYRVMSKYTHILDAKKETKDSEDIVIEYA